MSDLTWTNETRRLGDLKPQEDNPRLIREKQAERLNESWDEYGQVDLLAVGPGGEIYNGHQRYYVLLDRHGPDHPVECRVASRPLERREWQRLTVLLHEGAVGEWDFDGLANWEGVDFSDLVEWGFDADKLGVVIEQEPPTDPGPQIDRAEELREKWETARGQIWQIGKHRLMCGDSTSEEDIEGLVGAQKFGLVISSPPYFNQREYSQWDTYDEYLSFASLIVGQVTKICGKDALIGWNIGSDEQARHWIPSDWWVLFRDYGWLYREAIAWVKAAAVWNVPRSMHIEKGHYFPALRWEVILTVSRGKHPSFDLEDRNQIRKFDENVWEFSVVTGSEQKVLGHNAPFPVKIPRRFCLAYSHKNDLAYDPFLGSGTTMVAAEQTGRICYGMEIEPKYVAVTLERMAGMELEPKLVEQ